MNIETTTAIVFDGVMGLKSDTFSIQAHELPKNWATLDNEKKYDYLNEGGYWVEGWDESPHDKDGNQIEIVTKVDDAAALGYLASQGTAHEFQPQNTEWILCADFEDDMPLLPPARSMWHDTFLQMVENETGVKVNDLKGEDDPDYSEVARRLHLAGYDTYESDNYFEIYDTPTQCFECGADTGTR